MNSYRSMFTEQPRIPVLPAWLLRLAAPVLLLVTLPLAALVFAIALGTAGALAVAGIVTRAFTSPAGRPATAGFGPVIEGEYVVVAERRRPTRPTTPHY